MHSLFWSEAVTQHVKDGAKRAIGVMPLVKVETFGEGLEPDIGLLNRMVQRRYLGVVHFFDPYSSP